MVFCGRHRLSGDKRAGRLEIALLILDTAAIAPNMVSDSERSTPLTITAYLVLWISKV
jgi:hypothetical protein